MVIRNILPSLQTDHLQEVLTLFYVYINDVVMNYLESRGNVTNEERLDSACHAVFAGAKQRTLNFETKIVGRRDFSNLSF